MRVDLYVQIVPDRSSWNDSVYGAKRIKVTQRRPKPERMLPDALLTKVTFDIPSSRFMPRFTIEMGE